MKDTLRPTPAEGEHTLIRTQRRQIWGRFALALVVLCYLAAHAEAALLAHLPPVIAIILVYCVFNLFSLYWIRRNPRNMPQRFAAALLDICLASLGLWLDGGSDSPLYVMYFIIIADNGLRYGNVMLLYSQALSLIGLAMVGLLGIYGMQQSIDWLHLALQLGGIILVPGYVYLLGLRLDRELSARRQAEQDSVGLLDASPIPAFTFEPDNSGGLLIRYANPAMARMCALPQHELLGKPVARTCTPEDADAMRETCAKALLDAQPEAVQRFVVRNRKADGGLRELACQASSMRWQGHLLGLCLMGETGEEHPSPIRETGPGADYTNTVLAGMMHDLRNVLTDIIGSAEVAEMSAEDPELQQRLDSIIRSGEQGSELVRLLPHLMHGDKPVRGLFHLQDLLPATIKLALRELPSQIRLSQRMDDGLPPLFGYAAQIEWLLLQLIDNAAHAIRDRGRIEVRVEKDARHALAQPGLPALCLRVTDSGPGIAGDDLPHVFDPLWSSRQGEGAAGLGLAMVRRIVDWHHGEVAIRSAPDGGCEVVVHLPPHMAAEQVGGPA